VPAVLTFMFRSRFEAEGTFADRNLIAKGRRHQDAPGSSQTGAAGPESKASAFKPTSRMAPFSVGRLIIVAGGPRGITSYLLATRPTTSGGLPG
jgi:hypothetical protein